jgi:hypothetical protein
VVKASLGSVGDPGVSTLSFDPDSGLLEIVLADFPKRVVRWVDPSTGRTAAPPKRPAPSLASLPVGEAGFRAELLRPLRGLERPGRRLLSPERAPPGLEWSLGWCRNAVRTVDGSIIAVMDAKESEPRQGPLGDLHLLIATADPLRLRAEVPMRLTTQGPWATLLVLGERYAAARWAWTLTVVDLEHGQLRATVDTEASGGVVSLAPGGLLRAGPRLYDLTLPRAFDKGEEALIDPGWLPREVQIKNDPGGVSLWMRREGPAVRLSATGYQLADGIAAPGWLRCRLGEWILPLEACAQQLPAGRLALHQHR